MENEYFDEPRKCPNCGIVTYCDGCPTCGRKLPRSSTTHWKRLYGNRIAGEEEGVLQSEKNVGQFKQINIRNTQSGNQTFEDAKHTEPTIKFGGSHIKLNHPFFTTGEVTKEKPNKNTVVVIVAIIVIVTILLTLLIVRLQKYPVFSGNNKQIFLVQQGTITGNMENITLSDYQYDSFNEESTFLIENTGEQTFVTTIEFYRENEKRWSEHDIVVLPNESFEYTIYSDEEMDTYEFADYEFYDIVSPKPDFDFTVFNDYSVLDITTLAIDLQKEDLRMLTNYMIEATSYDAYAKASYINIYDGDDNKYEIYIEENKAEVYYMSGENDILDSFELLLDNENLGTTL